MDLEGQGERERGKSREERTEVWFRTDSDITSGEDFTQELLVFWCVHCTHH